MSNPCVKDLDAGQLDFMWNFLKFKGKDLSIHDIKGIKDNLDAIRQLMIQKTGGQKNYKKSYELDINDLGTYVNTVVIQAMSIYLCGGFDILEKYCEEGD